MRGCRGARCAAGACLVLICCAAAAGQPRTIAWRLDEGQQLRVRLVQTTRTQLQIEDQTTVLSLVAALEMRWRVDRVDADGGLHLRQAFTRMYLQSASPNAPPLTFDSASPDPPPHDLQAIAAAVRPLLASRVMLKISPQGEIAAVQPTAETESRLRDLPADVTWKNLLTNQGMNRAFRRALGRLPDRSVQSGARWQQTEEIETPAGQLRISSDYCYEGTAESDGRPLEVITATTQIRSARPPGAFDPPQSSGPNQRATYRFDLVAGHLAQSEVVQTLSAEAPAADLPVRVTASSTLVTRIVLVDAEVGGSPADK